MTIFTRQFFNMIRGFVLSAVVFGTHIPSVIAQETDRDQLIKQLQNPDKKLRIDAIHQLKPPRTDLTYSLMVTPSGSVQRVRAGKDALVPLSDEDPAVISAIMGMLDDPDEDVRCSAATSLGQFGPAAKDAVPSMIEGVTDPSGDFRASAIKALKKIDRISVEQEQQLIKGLTHAVQIPPESANDPKGTARRAAAFTLARCGVQMELAVPIIIEAMGDMAQMTREQAGDAIQYYGPDAVPLLMSVLVDGDQRSRYLAAEALSLLGQDAAPALPVLIDALDDPHQGIQPMVAQAIAAIGPEAKPAAPKMLELLADDDPYVRQSAANALGSLGPAGETAVPRLITLLDDTEPPVQTSAAQALGRIGPRAKAAVPRLIKLLNQKHINVDTIDAVIAALGGIGYEARPAVPTLVQILLFNHGSYSFYQNTAVYTLAKIGPQAQGVLPALLATLKIADSLVQTCAVLALADMGPDANVAIPALTKIRDEGSEELRLQAIYAIGKIDPQDQDAVRLLLQTMNRAYESEGIKLLGRLGIKAQSAVPDLIELLGDASEHTSRSIADALVNIAIESPQDTVSALVDALAGEQRSVRYWSAKALGRIGPDATSAVSALQAAMKNDDYWSVRIASRQAAQKILRATQQLQQKQNNPPQQTLAGQTPVQHKHPNQKPSPQPDDNASSHLTNQQIIAAADNLIQKVKSDIEDKKKKWERFTGGDGSYIPVRVTIQYKSKKITEEVIAGFLTIAWNSPAPGQAQRHAILKRAFHPREVREMFNEDLEFSNVRVIDEQLSPSELGQITVDALPGLQNEDAIESAAPEATVILFSSQ